MRAALVCLLLVGCGSPGGLRPTVVERRTVYTTTDSGNGAWPLWDSGSSGIARIGEDLFIAQWTAIDGLSPLGNARFTLTNNGEVVSSGQPEREPCPLGVIAGEPAVFTAPAATEGEYSPCVPQLLVGDKTVSWPGDFDQHTYRGMACDGDHTLLLASRSDGSSAWAIATSEGIESQGTIPYPMRSCYPVALLRNRETDILAVSDVLETRPWVQRLDGHDYTFRHLYHCHNFVPEEVDDAEATSGRITPLDELAMPDGSVLALWSHRSVQTKALRDALYPGTPLTTTIRLAKFNPGTEWVKDLTTGGERSPEPLWARLVMVSGQPAMIWTDDSGAMRFGFVIDGVLSSSRVVSGVKGVTNFQMPAERLGNAGGLEMLAVGDNDFAVEYLRLVVQ